MKVELVKIVIERRVRAGAESAFKDWSHRFVEAAARSPGHEGSSVLGVPNSRSQYILLCFASPADLDRWQGSNEFAALTREADAFGPAGEYSETKTGMETWFTLPDRPRASEGARELENGAGHVGRFAANGRGPCVHLCPASSDVPGGGRTVNRDPGRDVDVDRHAPPYETAVSMALP